MEIPFHVPYVYSPGSEPEIRIGARDVFHEYAAALGLQRGYKRGKPCYYREGDLIVFSMQRVFTPGSDPVDNAQTLDLLLRLMVALNVEYLRNHSALPLYGSGVVYGRTKEWEPIPSLYARGYGDCKSVATARVAEYAIQGIEAKPVFRWVKRANGDGVVDFHILVMVGNEFEDPSKILGMGANENAPIRH